MPTKSTVKAEAKPASKSTDAKKYPNNGHICMTAAEAKALQELLHHEKSRTENFKLNMHSMTRSRNPLLGEPTPREGEGEPILSGNSECATVIVPRKTKKDLADKIGTRLEKYEILGNNRKYDSK
jgi:hypothetical protein